MKHSGIFAIALAVFLAASALADGEDKIASAHNAFGFNCAKALVKEEKGKNVFISPTSIALALSMVYNGANGQTQKAMQQTLQLQGMDIAAINSAAKELMENLRNPDPQVQIAIANSVWARKGADFKKSFLDVVTQSYGAQSETLDFSDPSAAGIINAWVSQNTGSKIKKIVDPPIPPGMLMYLINAIYFKGSWTNEFDKNLTRERDFTTGEGSVKKHPLMRLQAKLPYYETAHFQSVELPYGKNKRLSMYVFLPKNLGDFVQALENGAWLQWVYEYRPTQGTILLPRFKIEYEKELKSALTDLGMGAAFEDSADFSGMGKNLKISQVKHKTYVDVNEEGTEAAAVTSVAMEATSAAIAPKEFYMEVNRPFFFAIVDNSTKEALFLGVVQNP